MECWPVKRAVQEHWRTPYFLQQHHINAEEALDSFELWFSLAGGGALSHADAYNEMTVSLQLRGSKEWRLAMHPKVVTVPRMNFEKQIGPGWLRFAQTTSQEGRGCPPWSTWAEVVVGVQVTGSRLVQVVHTCVTLLKQVQQCSKRDMLSKLRSAVGISRPCMYGQIWAAKGLKNLWL
eukprot:Skav216500  [mRNA]  locus=scaffold1123:585793:587276:- [translate_table: standard]